jgi:class 3 adenylate cyclase
VPIDAAGDAREVRKTVTVLFCDLTGSTALGGSMDPEALRLLLARYFERMRGIVESHGGTAGPLKELLALLAPESA